MFFLVHELIRNLDLQKQSGGVDLVRGARVLVFTGLAKIGAIARTIERDFALLAAALRTNAPVNRRAKTLFFANFTDRASQESNSPVGIMALALRIPPMRGSFDAVEMLRPIAQQISSGTTIRYHVGTHGRRVSTM
jgi:hypothetical protein